MQISPGTDVVGERAIDCNLLEYYNRIMSLFFAYFARGFDSTVPRCVSNLELPESHFLCAILVVKIAYSSSRKNNHELRRMTV